MSGINLLANLHQVDEKGIRSMNASVSHGEGSNFQIKKIRNTYLHIGAEIVSSKDSSKPIEQPLTSDDEMDFLAFEGELFNSFDLKNELIAKGVTFKSSSDAEVVLHALREFGLEVIGRFNGTYSLCYLDARMERVVLARDPHGIKPLYYFHNGVDFACASSSIKGVLASGNIAKEIDRKQVNHFLQFGFTEPSKTVYKDVFEVPRGSCMVLENWDEVKSYRFVSSEEKVEINDEINDEQLQQKFEDLLLDSISQSQAFRQDFGVLFDGTIQAALMMSLGHKHGIIPTQMFSISYGDEKSDEIIANMAYDLRTSNRAIELDKENRTLFYDYVRSMDQPVSDKNSFINYLISLKATDYVKYAWSSDGGAELTGGYGRDWAFYLYLSNYKNMVNYLPMLKKGAKYLPSALDFAFGGTITYIKKYANKIDPDPALTYHNLVSDNTLNLFEMPDSGIVSDPESPEFIESNLAKLIEFERGANLERSVLPINQAVYNQMNLELRLPYLDKQLSGFLKSIPEMKFFEQGRNWLFERTIRHTGLEKYLSYLKPNPVFPIGNMIKSNMFKKVLEDLKESKGKIYEYVDIKQAENIIMEHRAEQADHSEIIWRMLVLMIWLEEVS
ncbi:asparagine synthetase B family protein [Aureibacter tunicatorum]|uniref:asparagine synthase (glutamine-hydrolyzing) n=1 Tax=Aureibacter tunicatorum TaxID=866807 RepID=A0AAE4BRA9_9BACT|nr:asparagine synthase-related protein [Aureibacter tunicatorum]MDR6237580.1 asparagine synthase (glutamine-hydrolyzing) [Aureibacter tunicatorum]BDD02614.1 asparagine synthetase B [Aureibacter tunicatorum]